MKNFSMKLIQNTGEFISEREVVLKIPGSFDSSYEHFIIKKM